MRDKLFIAMSLCLVLLGTSLVACASVRKAVVTSSYRFGLGATRVGLYRYRVVAGANAGRAAATSGTLRMNRPGLLGGS